MKIIRNWNAELEEIDSSDDRYHDRRYELNEEDLAEILLSQQEEIKELKQKLEKLK